MQLAVNVYQPMEPLEPPKLSLDEHKIVRDGMYEYYASIDVQPHLEKLPKLKKGNFGGYQFNEIAFTRTVLDDNNRSLYWGSPCNDHFPDMEDYRFTMILSRKNTEGSDDTKKFCDNFRTSLMAGPNYDNRLDQLFLLHRNARNGVIDGLIELCIEKKNRRY